jgi:hypothetical protein
MSGCPIETLAYASGGLTEAEAQRVTAHLDACPLCSEELAWLRAERRLFEARAPELPAPPSFAGVLERLSASPREAPRRSPRPVGGRHATKARRMARREGARSKIERPLALLGLCAAVLVIGLLVRAGGSPEPVAVSPEPRPTAAAITAKPAPPAPAISMAPQPPAPAISTAPPSHPAEEPPPAAEGACDYACATEEDKSGPRPAEPPSADPAWVCGMSDCEDNLNVTCGP